MRSPTALALLTSCWMAGCVVDVQLDGKACDDEHPCAPGYACHAGRCVSAEAAGGLDGPCYPNGTCDDSLVCLAGVCAVSTTDAGPRDAGTLDAGPRDAGGVDAGPADAGPPDAGEHDAGEHEDGGGAPVLFPGFEGGTFTDTALEQGALVLAPSSPGVGEWTSPVFDAQSASTWTLSWTPEGPYGKALPDGIAESGYAAGSFDATSAEAVLHLDVVTDAGVQDTSGSDNHGVCTPPACPAPDGIGAILGAASFDGSSTYLALPDLPAGPMTVAAWVWRDASDSDAQLYTGIVSKWSPGVDDDDQWYLGVHEGMHSFWLKGTAGYLALDTSVPFEKDRWVHVAMTYDGVDLSCYVDGALVAGASLNEPVNDGSLAVLLGANGLETDRFFTGKLDEVLILGRPLAPAEVTSLHERAGLLAFLQVRGCDEPDCLSVPWVGPGGDPGLFFQDTTPGAPPQPVSLGAVFGARRYAQVRVLLGSTVSGRTPRIEDLTMRAAP